MDDQRPSNIIRLLRDNSTFILPFATVSVILATLLVLIGNHGLFMWVNQNNSGFADFVFVNLTILGNALVAFVLAVILLWSSYRQALSLLLITLILAAVISTLKRLVFPELVRPVLVFGSSALHLIEGYDPPQWYTFPSGHTATAFSVCFYLSILNKRKLVKSILFLIAFLVGYSRIYVSAHFPADVLGGAMLAILVTSFVYIQTNRIKSSGIDHRIRLDAKIFRFKSVGPENKE